MLFSLVLGQCSESMRQWVGGSPNYVEMASTLDGLALLIVIKNIAFQAQSQKYLEQALHEANWRFYNCHQKMGITVTAYLEQFQNMVDVIEHSGGDIGNDQGIITNMSVAKDVDMDLAADNIILAL
jgi:hypothetical protein